MSKDESKPINSASKDKHLEGNRVEVHSHDHAGHDHAHNHDHGEHERSSECACGHDHSHDHSGHDHDHSGHNHDHDHDHGEHEHSSQCACGHNHSHDHAGHDHDHSEHNHNHDHDHGEHEHSSECACGHDHSHDHAEHDHDHSGHNHDHNHDHGEHEHGSECACGHDHNHDHAGHDHDHSGHNHDHDHDHAGHDHSGHNHSHDHGHNHDHTENETDTGELDLTNDSLVFRVEGMDCADCAAKLRQQVAKLAGVTAAKLSFASARLTVQGGDAQSIVALVKDQGYQAYQVESLSASSNRKAVLKVDGMDCGECAKALEKQISRLDGVVSAKVSFASAKLDVAFNGTSLASIIAAIEKAGYQATPLQAKMIKQEKPLWWKQKRNQMTMISGITLTLGFILEYLDLASFAIPIWLGGAIIGGFYVARAGFAALRRGVMDMNFLMTVAAIGAAFIQQWEEAAAVVFLFSLGNAMQAYSMDHTRESIRALMDLAPSEATVLSGGKELVLPVESLSIGDRLLVRAGEKIPMDAEVVEGFSSVNQAAITGESTPLDVQNGDHVFAGTLNLQGALEIVVTKPYSESTVARILHLVEEAQDQRAPSQQFVDKFAEVYTPIVIGLAVAISILPPLLWDQDWSGWFYKALQLLVISCPCALTISTPVSIVSAIGNASRKGVLIKGGAYLEAAGAAQVVAFDKTGTLTTGNPEVKAIATLAEISEQQVLSIAAALEHYSTHPLAKAIVKNAQDKRISIQGASDFINHAGLGVSGNIAGESYRVGSERLLEGLELTPHLGTSAEQFKRDGMSLALVADSKQVLGIIGLADVLRPESAVALQHLKTSGVKHLALLTGDLLAPAKVMAKELAIDELHAELMPDDKLDLVRQLEKKYGSVIMVGDGINDAPAMAAATVSIAMGVAGSDIALETADMALMSDDLSKVAWCVALSRNTLSIIRQNISFSIITKLLVLGLTMMNMGNLMWAVFADSGTALIVILNGMRLMRWDQQYKPLKTERQTHSVASVNPASSNN